MIKNIPGRPGPTTIGSAKFKADPLAFKYTNGHISMLDGVWEISGEHRNYLTGPGKDIRLTLKGHMGPKSMRWFSGLFDVPPQIHITPLTLSESHINVVGNAEKTISAELAIKGGLKISTDLVLGPDKLNLKKLFIRDIQTNDGRSFGSVAGNTPVNTAQATTAENNFGFGDVNNNYPVDITGNWNNRYKFRVTVDDLEPKPVSMTPAGRALYESNEKYDDPVLRCLAYGLPRLFGNPYNMTIYDAGSHYLFLYVDHNSTRRIWMDGSTPGNDTQATANGFSMGHWEGDELVIETTHLLPGWLDGSGYPMSGEGTRIMERYSISDDGLTMDRVMTISDPYYNQPLTRVRGSARGANLDVSEQSACDPTGYFSDLLEAGVLEDYLDPDVYLNP